MKFVVIEGLDGSGKSTQVDLLLEYLKNHSVKYKFVHFPRPDAPIYGELISMFLRGEFGELGAVNPYLVALIYAGDRNEAKSLVNSWLDEGYLVLMDRYVNSNIAFQCAKIEDPDERAKLHNWIRKLEYEHNKIPEPTVNLFLNVPFEFTRNKLTQERTGEDRDYLKGQKDIHEASLDFQLNVRKVYHAIVEADDNIQMIDCCTADNEMISREDIHNKIINVLKGKGII